MNDEGEIALRVPSLARGDEWLYAAIEQLDAPLPTTSVNRAGEPACATWEDASAYLAGRQVFIPNTDAILAAAGGPSRAVSAHHAPPHESAAPAPDRNRAPSTLIRLHEDGAFTVLRAGAYSVVSLERRLA